MAIIKLKGVCSDSRSRLEAREKYDKVWVLPRAADGHWN